MGNTYGDRREVRICIIEFYTTRKDDQTSRISPMGHAGDNRSLYSSQVAAHHN
jgi:hypothetical protein